MREIGVGVADNNGQFATRKPAVCPRHGGDAEYYNKRRAGLMLNFSVSPQDVVQPSSAGPGCWRRPERRMCMRPGARWLVWTPCREAASG